MNSIEHILKKRFGGAVNIRGIDFQIIYSLSRALELFNSNCNYKSVRFEGIEDVDLIGFSEDDNFIQVKTSDISWNWAKFREPIKTFAEVAVIRPNCKFSLIFNFPIVKAKIQKLANYQKLELHEQNQIAKDLVQLCIKYGIEKSTINCILKNLSINSCNRIELINEIKRKLLIQFNLNTEIIDFYFYSFAYYCLEWAFARKTVTKNELNEKAIKISEGIERFKYFDSVGKSLITRVNWNIDKKPNDFYEAKKVRAGHIVDNLDIKRVKWLEKIHSAFQNNNICVIKALSGQGKSTIAYRYIFDNWDPNYVYIIKSAQTKQEADSISDYLIYLSKIGQPINILIDDVKEEIKYYSEILSTCSANGIKTLVTIRTEDDYRFTRKNITDYEIITPVFDLSEAKEIFKSLLKQNKVISDYKSAEFTFEKLGKNPLLLEYIFLLTQGKMLTDTLSEQLQIMRTNNETEKIEILRMISMANYLGAPVILQKLSNLFLNIDLQFITESIDNEFVTIDDSNFIHSIHFIRTKHLCELLHGKFINPVDTISKLIPCIPFDYAVVFVKNALNYPNADIINLIENLADYSKNTNLSFWINVVNGLFEGGEEYFFYQNKQVYDNVYQEFGDTLFFNSGLMPVIKLDTIDSMINILEGKKGDGFVSLRNQLSKVESTKRGFDFVSIYLCQLENNIDIKFVFENIKTIGVLLDWLHFSNIKLTQWNIIVTELVNFTATRLELADFCAFSQGFHRYDSVNYKIWFSKFNSMVLSYLKLELQLNEIDVVNNELFIKYIFSEQEPDLHKATMKRLECLRSGLPFCDKYCGSEIFSSLLLNKSDYNPSFKQISKSSLFSKSDIEKNAYLSKFTSKYYNPDTWFEFQQNYYDLRIKLLELIGQIILLKQNKISIKKFGHYFTKNIDILENLLKFKPTETPSEINDDLRKNFKVSNETFSSIRNTLFFLFTSENSDKRLIKVNYDDFLITLPVMQSFFVEIRKVCQIHFDFENLIKREQNLYKIFQNYVNEIK